MYCNTCCNHRCTCSGVPNAKEFIQMVLDSDSEKLISQKLKPIEGKVNEVIKDNKNLVFINRQVTQAISDITEVRETKEELENKIAISNKAINDNTNTINGLVSVVEKQVGEAILKSGFIIIDDFETGNTVYQRNEALRHTADGKLYRWAGNLPKVVPANSTPTSTGGIGVNAWLEVSDATLRQEIITGGLITDAAIKTVAPVGGIERTQRDKNSDFVSVKDFGAKGDGVADDTAAIQAAIDSGFPISIPVGVYNITSTLHTQRNSRIVGQGSDSIINAVDITGPAILTYSGSGTPTAPNQFMGHFAVIGQATCAIAFSHFAVSEAKHIYLSARINGVSKGFKGQDGFVFEYFWGSTFSNLYTNGAGIESACFKFNKVILGSNFSQLYTSNLSDYSFWVSGGTEWSTGTGVGTRDNIIDLPIAQGARLYGIRIDSGTNFIWRCLYTENNIGSLLITGGIQHTFEQCGFGGLNISSGLSDHGIFVGGDANISHITFRDCGFYNSLFVMGKTTSSVLVDNPRLVSEIPFWGTVRRTSDTPIFMPLTVIEQNGGGVWRIRSKTSNYGHKFAYAELGVQVVDGVEQSAWKHQPIEVVPLTDVMPYHLRTAP